MAMALKCPLDDVIVGTNSTATVPNGGCTGGSGTSESVVGAALNACKELNATLNTARADAAAAAGGAAGAAGDEMSMETRLRQRPALGWASQQPGGSTNQRLRPTDRLITPRREWASLKWKSIASPANCR